jgi:hypothetical protein
MREHLTGAPTIQLCQMAVLSAGSRCTAGTDLVAVEDRIRVEVRDDGGPWLQHDPGDDRPHGPMS